jgi:hypothetical protein
MPSTDALVFLDRRDQHQDEVNHAIAAHRRWSSICLAKNTGLCAQTPPISTGYF